MEAGIAGFPLGGTFKNFCVAIKARPGILGHRHRKAFADTQLAPHQEAAGRRKVKIVTAPYDLRLGYAEKLIEIFFSRGHVPGYDFFPVLLRPGSSGSLNRFTMF